MSNHIERSKRDLKQAAYDIPDPGAGGICGTACQPHGGVALEEAIRVRAFQKWERAGSPPGDGLAFWLEAEAELKGV